jgi:hypothetical protein
VAADAVAVLIFDPDCVLRGSVCRRNTSLPWRATAQEGIRAVACIPLSGADVPIGKFVLYYNGAPRVSKRKNSILLKQSQLMLRLPRNGRSPRRIAKERGTFPRDFLSSRGRHRAD